MSILYVYIFHFAFDKVFIKEFYYYYYYYSLLLIFSVRFVLMRAFLDNLGYEFAISQQ